MDKLNFKQRRMKGGRVNPTTLPKGENGYCLCRWCKREVAPPRITFCSKECVHEHRMRTNTSYMKTLVYKRDKAICAICGTDTKIIARDILVSRSEKNFDEVKALHEKWGVHKKRRVWKRKWGGGLWDADHVVRVEHGGGMCGMENIRTLCIPCHKSIAKKKS